MHIYTYTLCIYTGLNNAHEVAVAPTMLPVSTRRSLGFCLEPSSGRMETEGADAETETDTDELSDSVVQKNSG